MHSGGIKTLVKIAALFKPSSHTPRATTTIVDVDVSRPGFIFLKFYLRLIKEYITVTEQGKFLNSRSVVRCYFQRMNSDVIFNEIKKQKNQIKLQKIIHDCKIN